MITRWHQEFELAGFVTKYRVQGSIIKQLNMFIKHTQCNINIWYQHI